MRNDRHLTMSCFCVCLVWASVMTGSERGAGGSFIGTASGEDAAGFENMYCDIIMISLLGV